MPGWDDWCEFHSDPEELLLPAAGQVESTLDRRNHDRVGICDQENLPLTLYFDHHAGLRMMAVWFHETAGRRRWRLRLTRRGECRLTHGKL